MTVDQQKLKARQSICCELSGPSNSLFALVLRYAPRDTGRISTLFRSLLAREVRITRQGG